MQRHTDLFSMYIFIYFIFVYKLNKFQFKFEYENHYYIFGFYYTHCVIESVRSILEKYLKLSFECVCI